MREIHHGRRLPVNMGVREQVETHGWAPQCRATSEVPPGPDTSAGLRLTGCGVQTWLDLPTLRDLGKGTSSFWFQFPHLQSGAMISPNTP